MTHTPVHGSVEPGFESVREIFERNVDEIDLGAAVCGYVGGRKVVDLWGGWADAGRTREWEHDTIAATFSTTKLMTATCAHRLVERGELDVDEPVATYWPEFAQAGKDEITVRMLLNHQSGLPWTTGSYPREKWLDWPTVTAALAAQAPIWEPGTRSEYHGGTFGFLVGTVVERIDGRPLSTFFQEEIAEPLGADFLIGFGPEHDGRCAEMVGPDDMVGGSNTREWRAAGDGAATGSGSAEGIARVCAALAGGGVLDGVHLLSRATIDAAVQEQPLARGDGTAGDFGLGYQLFWKLFPGMNTDTFGHTGMGGSVALADRRRGIGFGYVMNKMGSGGGAPLVNDTYRSLLA